MKHKVYVSNIEWDTDDWLYIDDEPDLPSSLELIVDDALVEMLSKEEEEEYDFAGSFSTDKQLLSDYISDYLSDNYKYCHNGFAFEIVWDYEEVKNA